MSLEALESEVKADVEKIPAEIAGEVHTFLAYAKSEIARLRAVITGKKAAADATASKMVAPTGAPSTAASNSTPTAFGDPVQTPVAGAAPIEPAAGYASNSQSVPAGSANGVQSINGSAVTAPPAAAPIVGTRDQDPPTAVVNEEGQKIVDESGHPVAVTDTKLST